VTNIRKKKKDNTSMMSKAAPINVAANASKSLEKGKLTSKILKPSGHISLEKNHQRDTAIKTQMGFYVLGDSLIHTRSEEDQSHCLQPENYYSNKIYNAKVPNSRSNYRWQTNLNTEEIKEEEGEGSSHSTMHLPFLGCTSQKSTESKPQPKNNQMMPQSMMITNNAFNYRHH
jgi:hypothetical protein